LIAGILFSTIPSETKSSLQAFFHFFQLIGQANLLMVTFTIGLILEFKKLPHIYLFLGIAIFLKLVLKPLLAIYFTQSSDFTDMMREIVMIETALPSAILTAVFAKQYDCRPDLVSMAIMLSLIFSLISVPFMFYVFF
jgi:predicted permease